jgi:hypothetical protein
MVIFGGEIAYGSNLNVLYCNSRSPKQNTWQGRAHYNEMHEVYPIACQIIHRPAFGALELPLISQSVGYKERFSDLNI